MKAGRITTNIAARRLTNQRKLLLRVRRRRHVFHAEVNHDHAVLFIAVRHVRDECGAARSLRCRATAPGDFHHFGHALIGERVVNRIAKGESVLQEFRGFGLRRLPSRHPDAAALAVPEFGSRPCCFHLRYGPWFGRMFSVPPQDLLVSNQTDRPAISPPTRG